jgi:hypothetical protein
MKKTSCEQASSYDATSEPKVEESQRERKKKINKKKTKLRMYHRWFCVLRRNIMMS